MVKIAVDRRVGGPRGILTRKNYLELYANVITLWSTKANGCIGDLIELDMIGNYIHEWII